MPTSMHAGSGPPRHGALLPHSARPYERVDLKRVPPRPKSLLTLTERLDQVHLSQNMGYQEVERPRDRALSGFHKP